MDLQAFWPIFAGFVSIMLTVIGYFLKQAVAEQRQFGHDLRKLLIEQAKDQANLSHILGQITDLKASDARTTESMIDLMRRLIRLEERDHGQPGRQTPHYPGTFPYGSGPFEDWNRGATSGGQAPHGGTL